MIKNCQHQASQREPEDHRKLGDLPFKTKACFLLFTREGELEAEQYQSKYQKIIVVVNTKNVPIKCIETCQMFDDLIKQTENKICKIKSQSSANIAGVGAVQKLN